MDVVGGGGVEDGARVLAYVDVEGRRYVPAIGEVVEVATIVTAVEVLVEGVPPLDWIGQRNVTPVLQLKSCNVFFRRYSCLIGFI